MKIVVIGSRMGEDRLNLISVCQPASYRAWLSESRLYMPSVYSFHDRDARNVIDLSQARMLSTRKISYRNSLTTFTARRYA